MWWHLASTYIFKVIRPWLRKCVRSVASKVLDGFFLYLAQMITIIRGCVTCYVFFQNLEIWIFGRQNFWNFSALTLKKNLQFSMDSFHIWYKWSLVWEGVLHIMTFDLDLYFQSSFGHDLENRVRSVTFSVLDRLFFWFGIQYDSIVWVIMRRRGYPQNAGVLVLV